VSRPKPNGISCQASCMVCSCPQDMRAV
jgi:hypothetical protein